MNTGGPACCPVCEPVGQGGRRDGHDRALGMGQAVAADLGKDQPAQRTTAASPDD